MAKLDSGWFLVWKVCSWMPDVNHGPTNSGQSPSLHLGPACLAFLWPYSLDSCEVQWWVEPRTSCAWENQNFRAWRCFGPWGVASLFAILKSPGPESLSTLTEATQLLCDQTCQPGHPRSCSKTPEPRSLWAGVNLMAVPKHALAVGWTVAMPGQVPSSWEGNDPRGGLRYVA